MSVEVRTHCRSSSSSDNSSSNSSSSSSSASSSSSSQNSESSSSQNSQAEHAEQEQETTIQQIQQTENETHETKQSSSSSSSSDGSSSSSDSSPSSDSSSSSDSSPSSDSSSSSDSSPSSDSSSSSSGSQKAGDAQTVQEIAPTASQAIVLDKQQPESNENENDKQLSLESQEKLKISCQQDSQLEKQTTIQQVQNLETNPESKQPSSSSSSSGSSDSGSSGSSGDSQSAQKPGSTASQAIDLNQQQQTPTIAANESGTQKSCGSQDALEKQNSGTSENDPSTSSTSSSSGSSSDVEMEDVPEPESSPANAAVSEIIKSSNLEEEVAEVKAENNADSKFLVENHSTISDVKNSSNLEIQVAEVKAENNNVESKLLAEDCVKTESMDDDALKKENNEQKQVQAESEDSSGSDSSSSDDGSSSDGDSDSDSSSPAVQDEAASQNPSDKFINTPIKQLVELDTNLTVAVARGGEQDLSILTKLQETPSINLEAMKKGTEQQQKIDQNYVETQINKNNSNQALQNGGNLIGDDSGGGGNNQSANPQQNFDAETKTQQSVLDVAGSQEKNAVVEILSSEESDSSSSEDTDSSSSEEEDQACSLKDSKILQNLEQQNLECSLQNSKLVKESEQQNENIPEIQQVSPTAKNLSDGIQKSCDKSSSSGSSSSSESDSSSDDEKVDAVPQKESLDNGDLRNGTCPENKQEVDANKKLKSESESSDSSDESSSSSSSSEEEDEIETETHAKEKSEVDPEVGACVKANGLVQAGVGDGGQQAGAADNSGAVKNVSENSSSSSDEEESSSSGSSSSSEDESETSGTESSSSEPGGADGQTQTKQSSELKRANGDTKIQDVNCPPIKKLKTEQGSTDDKGVGKKRKFGEEVELYNKNTVHVQMVQFTATEQSLQQHFSQCGEVDSVQIVRNADGEAKGLAFVTFKKEESAEAAVEKLNNSMLDSSHMKVSRPSTFNLLNKKNFDQETNRVFVKGFQACMDGEVVRAGVEQAFKHCGEVVSVQFPQLDKDSLQPITWALVQFDTLAAKEEAKRMTGRQTVLGGELVVRNWMHKRQKPSQTKVYEKSSNVYVRFNNTSNIQVQDLERYFASCGNIMGVKIVENKGYGFVNYDNVESAVAAVKNLNHTFINGSKIVVNFAVSTHHTPERGQQITHNSNYTSSNLDEQQNNVRGSQQLQPGNTIYVKGFDNKLNEWDIRGQLEQVFGSCGEITTIKLPKKQGEIQHFAFVIFASQKERDAALQMKRSDLQIGNTQLYPSIACSQQRPPELRQESRAEQQKTQAKQSVQQKHRKQKAEGDLLKKMQGLWNQRMQTKTSET